MAMDLPPISTSTPPAAVASTADAKRAQLQAILLKKSLEAQRAQAAEISRQIEGKGQRLDIRV